MNNYFTKKIEVKKKHHGDYDGTHSGYVYTWTMDGKECQCTVERGVRGKNHGTVRIDDSGISFIST